MSTENIDDLFRQELDGHATPPGADLWARLAAKTEAQSPIEPERLDQLFRQGLHAHATPPRRELWERLEDEHLRPRKRRAAAWWPMALAAALALLLVAGGAGLWSGYSPSGQNGSTASRPASKQKSAGNVRPAAPADGATTPAAAATGAPVAATGAASTKESGLKVERVTGVEKNITAQATHLGSYASTAPKATKTPAEPAARRLTGISQQPDAAAGSVPQVARVATPAKASARPSVADEQRLAVPTAPVVSNSLAAASLTAAVAAPGATAAEGVILVDVRGGASAPVSESTPAVATAEPLIRRRRLGERLLQQANHLARGERLSLAEATGLPETVTVRATIAGRTLTKSIQL